MLPHPRGSSNRLFRSMSFSSGGTHSVFCASGHSPLLAWRKPGACYFCPADVQLVFCRKPRAGRACKLSLLLSGGRSTCFLQKAPRRPCLQAQLASVRRTFNLFFAESLAPAVPASSACFLLQIALCQLCLLACWRGLAYNYKMYTIRLIERLGRSLRNGEETGLWQ